MDKTGKILKISLLAVLITASGSAQNTHNSSTVNPGLVPGDLFYPVESFVKNLETSIAGFIGGEKFKAKALANNAVEKVAEVEELAERNKTDKAAVLTERYAQEINKSKQIAEKNNNRNLSDQLESISEKNVEKLEKVREIVPGNARERIEKAINQSNPKGKKKASEKREKSPVEKRSDNRTPRMNGSSRKKSNNGKQNKEDSRGTKNLSDIIKETYRDNKSLNNSGNLFENPESSQKREIPEDSSIIPDNEEVKHEENPIEKDRKDLL